MKRTRLLLGDDHMLVVEGLRKLLEPEFDLVGTAADGRAVIAAAKKLRPDVILLDISMPGMNGMEAARRLKKIVPRAKLIFLTMHADPVYLEEAARLGAAGYVLKRSAASELAAAIRQVVQGGRYGLPRLGPRQRALAGARPAAGRNQGHSSLAALTPRQHPAAALTPRQREVLQLVAEGGSNKEIAAALEVSVKTVEFHKAGLMSALGLRTVAALTQFAIKHKIIGL